MFVSEISLHYNGFFNGFLKFDRQNWSSLFIIIIILVPCCFLQAVQVLVYSIKALTVL